MVSLVRHLPKTKATLSGEVFDLELTQQQIRNLILEKRKQLKDIEVRICKINQVVCNG
jgi:hypothetical protein